MTDENFEKARELKSEITKLWKLISDGGSAFYIGGKECTINSLFKVNSSVDKVTHNKIMQTLRDRASDLESEFNKL